MLKTCSGCKAEKPLDQFHKGAKSKDGRQSRCQECARSAARQWNAANKERKNTKARELRESWTPERKAEESEKTRLARAADPEKVHAQKRASYQRNREVALERQRAYRQTPEAKARAKERQKEYHARNPRARHRQSIKQAYGMSLEEFDALVLDQLGRCKICRCELVSPAVDHCHNSLKVRGLLCGPCNTGLGLLRDDVSILASAIEYLS